MMLLDTIVLAILRPFRKFSHLQTFECQKTSAEDAPHAVDGTRPQDWGIEAELEVDGEKTEA